MARVFPEPVTVSVTPDLKRWHAVAALVEKHVGAFRADLETLMAREAEDEGTEGERM